MPPSNSSPDDYLVFGRETAGLPKAIIGTYRDGWLRIPMFHAGSARSICPIAWRWFFTRPCASRVSRRSVIGDRAVEYVRRMIDP